MFKQSFLFLSILFTLSVSAQDWIPFRDSSGLFTAKYPAGWTSKIKSSGAVFFTSPKDGNDDSFLENINILIRKSPDFDSSFDMKSIMPEVINNLEAQMKNFKYTSERYFTWNNKKAAELRYTTDYGGDGDESPVHIKITQWFCTMNGILCTATYTSLAGDSPHDKTALKILENIRFLKN